MKKMLVMFALLLLFASITTAQNPIADSKLIDNIVETKGKIDTTYDTIDEIKSGSLDLNTIESNLSLSFYETSLGKKILPLNPVINPLVGMNFTISRLFLLTLILWVALFLIIYRLSAIIKIYFPRTPRLIISLVLIVGFSWIGGTKAVALSVMTIVNSFESPILKLISFISIIIILAIIIVYSKILEKISFSIKKENRTRKTEKKAERAIKETEETRKMMSSEKEKTEEEQIEEQVRDEFEGIAEDDH